MRSESLRGDFRWICAGWLPLVWHPKIGSTPPQSLDGGAAVTQWLEQHRPSFVLKLGWLAEPLCGDASGLPQTGDEAPK